MLVLHLSWLTAIRDIWPETAGHAVSIGRAQLLFSIGRATLLFSVCFFVGKEKIVQGKEFILNLVFYTKRKKISIGQRKKSILNHVLCRKGKNKLYRIRKKVFSILLRPNKARQVFLMNKTRPNTHRNLIDLTPNGLLFGAKSIGKV